MGRFDGKVLFVSGAARGQGRAHAVRFAQEGADVIAVDACTNHAGLEYAMATDDDLAETVRLVEAAGGRIVARKADVRSQEQLDAAVAEGLSEFGRIDVVLANAGVFTMAESSWQLTEDQWKTTLDIDLSGVWRTCKAAIPSMIEGKRGGAIVLTATSNGYRAEQGHGAYNAAKLGVVALMRAFAGELGQYDIRVNTVHPSIVRTNMMWNDMLVPLLCPGETTATISQDEYYDSLRSLHLLPHGSVEPTDISEVMLFLASDAGRFITASEFFVDEGYIRKVG
ncbi:mycofactocin-coupled SDR family oxidoreductase [Gordonia sp. TBRC 11910]|uniref:Mycofactocin-coupled SDR family oxidoreductase n=1 Tax=Gordonia asplenii TaxID=2725283 RepID=A0A848KR58_9ACTN|nr:mycofactocin-coupled SDR family oxidoreductase [Gordonia asplenii]NMO00870.1 mycofactocin-coupled SDR family oxidoreductase [Gordonia asplenii]